MKEVFIYR